MKRTFTEKLKIVSQALSGIPQRRLCVQYHLGQHYLENLIDRYRKYGEEGLYRKAQKKISPDFKVKLVRDFIEKGVSLRQICNENEISRTAFESWVRKASYVPPELSHFSLGGSRQENQARLPCNQQ